MFHLLFFLYLCIYLKNVDIFLIVLGTHFGPCMFQKLYLSNSINVIFSSADWNTKVRMKAQVSLGIACLHSVYFHYMSFILFASTHTNNSILRK